LAGPAASLHVHSLGAVTKSPAPRQSCYYIY